MKLGMANTVNCELIYCNTLHRNFLVLAIITRKDSYEIENLKGEGSGKEPIPYLVVLNSYCFRFLYHDRLVA